MGTFCIKSASSFSHTLLCHFAADGGEAGRQGRADIQTLPGRRQERQRGSVIRRLPVSHAQGDPPASQLGPPTANSHLHLYEPPPLPPPPHRSIPVTFPCERKRLIFFPFLSFFFKNLIN